MTRREEIKKMVDAIERLGVWLSNNYDNSDVPPYLIGDIGVDIKEIAAELKRKF